MDAKQLRFFAGENAGARKNGGSRKTVVYSAIADSGLLLESLIRLHCPRGVDVDLTVGKGASWKGFPREGIPRVRIDSSRTDAGNVIADATRLPLRDKSARAVYFDPPWMVTASPGGIMAQRYGSFPSIPALVDFYKRALIEAARILRPRGILIFKCQDFVHGRQNYPLHVDVVNMARSTGFNYRDAFIFIATHRPISPYSRQNFSRKNYCYFIVFKRLQKNQSARAGE